MATNSMTPEQDLLTREFFLKVSTNDTLFPTDPVAQRNMNRTLLALLNYDYVNGAYVECGTKLTRSLTGKATAECEWNADTDRAMEAIDETDKSESEDEADSSESATDTEVREAVLREDV